MYKCCINFFSTDSDILKHVIRKMKYTLLYIVHAVPVYSKRICIHYQVSNIVHVFLKSHKFYTYDFLSLDAHHKNK